MPRFLHSSVLIWTAIVSLIYCYCAVRSTNSPLVQSILSVPFMFVWIVPVVYWYGQRESRKLKSIDLFIHMGSYLSLGWLSFLFVILVLRDMVMLVLGQLTNNIDPSTANSLNLPDIYRFLEDSGGPGAVLLSILIWIIGTYKAARGPYLKDVEVEIPNLPPALEGFRIVQISDLHIGTTIRRPYTERVVAQTTALSPDMIVLTGDLVDGAVSDLAPHIAPLADLKAKYGCFVCLGNHDYYSGAKAWTEHLQQSLGLAVLRNEHAMVDVLGANLLVAGVTDPASYMDGPGQEPDPELALKVSISGENRPHSDADFKILLAHNPKLAGVGAKAGFQLQLSGHTHAGQFIPWTLVTRLVHSPHYAGLSKERDMLVYVSAGTGSWGPPLRFGTMTELTLLRLTRGIGP